MLSALLVKFLSYQSSLVVITLISCDFIPILCNSGGNVYSKGKLDSSQMPVYSQIFDIVITGIILANVTIFTSLW